MQTRYTIKEIGPRIPVAFVASALSLFFVDKLIQLANALTLAILDGGVAPPTMASTVQDAIHSLQSGGLFFILVALVLIVAGLALLLVYVVRLVITILLIVSGPLFLMCHALPHTDGIARWWWKATAATLAIQVAQALVLITAVRTVLSGGSQLLGSSALPALGTTLAAVALFFVLFKIPFWLLNAANVGTGRSFLGSLVRTAVAAKAFGLIARKTGLRGMPNVTRTRNQPARRDAPGNPTGPPRPRPSSPEMVNKRLKAAFDAERAQAARRARVPSQAPRFLQPSPQESVHDPAVTPPVPAQTVPEFISPSAPETPMSRPRRGPRPGSAPTFRKAGAPPRRGRTRTAGRAIRTAAVPPQLKFQSAVAPESSPRPTKSPTAPASPVFRPAQPEPRLGDAAKRTHAAPPPLFRPPARLQGGDRK
ncbi:hypothetical protein [Amycolatopsis sp. NPDC051372]|uniref:hypothetical protein n=1 Tax=Amycolatopsis sp. NPDC051372 TaxID=3155669 RepID=UPI0034453030